MPLHRGEREDKDGEAEEGNEGSPLMEEPLQEALPRTSTRKSLRVSEPVPCTRQVYRPWWKGWRGLSWSWLPPDTRPCSRLLSARRQGEGGCRMLYQAISQGYYHAPLFPPPGPRSEDIVKAEDGVCRTMCITRALQEKRATGFGTNPCPSRYPKSWYP